MGSNSHAPVAVQATGFWPVRAITDEPCERIVHARVCGGRRVSPAPTRQTSQTLLAPNFTFNWKALWRQQLVLHPLVIAEFIVMQNEIRNV